jgi:hypothetical protein
VYSLALASRQDTNRCSIDRCASEGPPRARLAGIPFSDAISGGKPYAVVTLSGLATEVNPETVGLDPDRLARLDRYLDAIVA